MNLPNKLTLTRIVLVPVFMIFVSLTSLDAVANGTFQPLYYLLAGIVFAAASFTDFLDGHLARKWNMVTDFGKFAKVGDHVPLAGQMTVQKVGEAGRCKNNAGQQVIQRLEGAVGHRVQTGEGHKDHEHRHQHNAGQGKFIGQIHRFYPPIRYFTTVPYKS